MDKIRKLVEKYSASQMVKPSNRTNKNKKPEAELVLKIKNHLLSIGWSIDIIESKAVYSPRAGRYLRGQAVAGTPDLVGNDPLGLACFIEVKAKDRRHTLRPAQHDFLSRKIETGCFAVVVDSVELIHSLYKGWKDAVDKKEFLLSNLPSVPKRFKY